MTVQEIFDAALGVDSKIARATMTACALWSIRTLSHIDYHGATIEPPPLETDPIVIDASGCDWEGPLQ